MTTTHQCRACRPQLLIALAVLAVATPVLAQQASDDSVLVAKDRAMWDALKNRDTSTFARLMGDGVVDIDASGSRRTSPASVARFVMGCQTPSYAMSDVHVVHDGALAIVTSRVTLDQTCWGQKAPSPLLVMTVFSRRGNDWSAIAHSETPAARY